ncbi:unnamed protein product [Cylicocyclus nassatus]|uniref:Uncharacterized protein n=1 Tax=Cylicocyclus nassatus TaxID=53992 RepID=A0AA36HF00_CYLNA|nr:unnamed protein product [Cylicocyclus nassatus]
MHKSRKSELLIVSLWSPAHSAETSEEFEWKKAERTSASRGCSTNESLRNTPFSDITKKRSRNRERRRSSAGASQRAQSSSFKQSSVGLFYADEEAEKRA